jgi:SAM-dependent methyltransferase
MRLRLSRQLSWHARGEAAYSWDRRSGDVCEMSRDVVALCLAFEGGAARDPVCDERPGGIDPGQARQFCAILVERGILEADAEDDPLALGRRRPYVPKLAIWERVGEDAIVYGRASRVRRVGGARFLDGADGSRPLSELAPESEWAEWTRLCEADLAALKLLPDGAGIPRWAESTMPWPEVEPRALADGKPVPRDPHALADYHQTIADAERQFEEIETTLSHLFRAPHRSLGGQTFGQRLAHGLIAGGVAATGARVVEVGGGLGWVGRELSQTLAPRSYLVVDRSPELARAQRRRGLTSVVGDAAALPIADGAVDLLISNEMAGDLGTDGGKNVGALALVDEIARVLAPGGLAYVSEFGHPTAAPTRSDHLDHDEYSIRFDDLKERAIARGLGAEVVALPSLIGLDGSALALVTTRASFAALRALFRAHGGDLEKRAWLIDELAAHARAIGLDLATVHGVASAPIGERTMGLVPNEFWALIAKK